MNRGVAEKFWKQLEDFAAYCFNKSHAACYGLIAYWTAYLKAHHPAAFMAALMTSDYDDTDRLAIEINECQHMNIDVLQPDVNESFVEFAVVPTPAGKKPQIRFGMAAVKNVGTSAVEEIIRAREIDGQFASLEDFLGKVNNRVVNRKTLESLIKAGGFDRFGDRNLLLGNIDTMVAYANRLHKQADSGQTDLFGEDSADVATAMPKLILDPEVTVYPLREQLQWERELLGLYLSQHPLEPYTVFLSEHSMPLSEFNSGHDSKAVTVGGIISELREITTKNGQKMAFIKIADVNGEIELILFPNAYQQTTGIWERDRVVLVRGKISAKDREGNISNELKVMVDDAREVTLEQATAYQATGKVKKAPKVRKAAVPMTQPPSITQASMPGMERLYIRLENSDDQKLLVSLKETIDGHKGETEVVLVLGPAASKQIVKLPTRVNREDGVLVKLHALVGEPNVVVR